MAGRHRRPPAWRRALLRLRRSDHAARTAALQAEVVALRTVVAELRTQLVTAEAAQAVAALARAAAEAEATATVQAAVEKAVAAARAGADRPKDLRYVTIDLPMVAYEPSVIDLRELPEAALLDPRRDRGAELADPAVRAAHKVSAGKHARPELRRIA